MWGQGFIFCKSIQRRFFDYGTQKEYDVPFTNHYLESLNLFDDIDALEKTMVLEVNNDIKFPVKMVKAYNSEEKMITSMANYMKLNVPSLLSNDQAQAYPFFHNKSSFGSYISII